MEKIKKVQRDLVVKHRAKQAMSGRTVSAPEVPPAANPPGAVVEKVRTKKSTSDRRGSRIEATGPPASVDASLATPPDAPVLDEDLDQRGDRCDRPLSTRPMCIDPHH